MVMLPERIGIPWGNGYTRLKSYWFLCLWSRRNDSICSQDMRSASKNWPVSGYPFSCGKGWEREKVPLHLKGPILLSPVGLTGVWHPGKAREWSRRSMERKIGCWSLLKASSCLSLLSRSEYFPHQQTKLVPFQHPPPRLLHRKEETPPATL